VAFGPSAPPLPQRRARITPISPRPARRRHAPLGQGRHPLRVVAISAAEAGQSATPPPTPRPPPRRTTTPRRRAGTFRGAHITSLVDGDTTRLRRPAPGHRRHRRRNHPTNHTAASPRPAERDYAPRPERQRATNPRLAARTRRTPLRLAYGLTSAPLDATPRGCIFDRRHRVNFRPALTPPEVDWPPPCPPLRGPTRRAEHGDCRSSRIAVARLARIAQLILVCDPTSFTCLR
jgi:hypothetical protein